MKTNVIGILLIASGVFFLQSCGGEQAETTEQEVKLKPLVKLQEVQRKSFEHKIQVQGNVETDQNVTLSAEMGGLITSITVKEGQTVRKGHVIARVDASVLASNVQEIKTKLEYAEYMLEKQKELQKRGVGSEFDLETAQSQVNSLKASMNSLNTQAGKAVIRAPFTGVIDQVYAKKGQMAGPSSPLVRLVNNDAVDIVAMISEKHFSKVRLGTPINVTFPNYSDTSIDLKITNVGNYIEPTNRTFRIMAEVKKNKTLLPNMLAEVSITDLQKEDAIVIPTSAILKDQESRDFVYIATSYTEKQKPAEKSDKKDEKAEKKTAPKNNDPTFQVEKRIITVIEKYDGQALISPSSPIKVGEQVVVEGARGIADKDIVRTKSK